MLCNTSRTGTLGLEVNEADIQELVEEHEQELTTDELMDLHCKQQQEIMEHISSEVEEKKTEESLTSNEIREMCKMWETAKFCRETPPEQGCNSASNEYFQ